MDFLVAMDMSLPPDMTAGQRDALYAAEERRTTALAAQGALKRLWRVPGTQANWGIWAAPDAAALKEVFDSLPLRAWIEVTEVHPLDPHPLDPQRGA